MTQPSWRSRESGPAPRCDHCGYPIPEERIAESKAEAETGGRYCSEPCRERGESDAPSFVDGRPYTRFRTGVEPLDVVLPDGVPADAFVLVSGDEGTRRSELGTELVWRALRRGEPAVVVAFANPPTAVLERFFALGWNVLPYLADDRLRIVDCFSRRLADRDAFESTQNEWNRFVASTADDAVVEVRDSSDVREVANSLHGCLDDLEMTETGVVVIDSLDELNTLVQDRIVHNFVKDVRASVCKARYVPMFTSATTSGDRAYPADDEYVFDGLVDMRLVEDQPTGMRRKQLGVRKLVGGQYVPRWVTFECASDGGLFAFDESETRAVYGRDRSLPEAD